jgi:hypothetical protein
LIGVTEHVTVVALAARVIGLTQVVLYRLLAAGGVNAIAVLLGEAALAVKVKTSGVPEFSTTLAGLTATEIAAKSSLFTVTVAAPGDPTL